MNKRIISEGLILFLIIGLTFFLIKSINLVDEQDIENFTKEQEEKIGDIFLQSFTLQNKEIKDQQIDEYLEILKDEICGEDSDLSDQLKIHVLNNSEVNAMALPGDHVIIFTGIIKDMKKPEELISVLAHEIGHIKRKHIKRKFQNEIGINIISAVLAGNASQEMVKNMLEKMMSSSFSRELETEADDFATSRMQVLNYDPEHFANFLYRLSDLNDELTEVISFVSSHPHSADRAIRIMEKKNENPNEEYNVLDMEEWEIFKEKVLSY